MSSPTPKQASDALWWVSNDPNSRQLAEMREMSERAHRHTMAATREEGRIEGREEGFTEGLRVQIRSLAKVLNIELTAQKQERLAGMGSEQLQQLAETLIRDREWL